MDNPAAPSDLADRGYTGLTSSQVQQTWLDVAWRALLAESPDLPARIDSGAIDRLSVIDIVCAAVLRVLRNPEGFTQHSTSIDDYSESGQRSDATQDIYFTAAELRRLRGDVEPVHLGWSGSIRYGR